MNVVLISTYELGHQPFGLASPAAWLRARGAEVTCLDLSRQRLEGKLAADVARAHLIAFYVPMHTATRLAAQLLPAVRCLNPRAHLCFYGLYAPVNEAYLRGLGVETILGGEFEAGLANLSSCLPEWGTTTTEVSSPSAAGSVIALDRLNFAVPDRSGLPTLSQYARVLLPNGRSLVAGYTEASRGCKHLCRHCPIVPVYNGVFRVVSREVVMEDIRRQVAAGAEHITFGDPDFFNGPRHALSIVEELHDEFPKLSYDVTIKIEHLLRHAEDLPRLRETGCLFVTTAVESLDDAVLVRLDKGHTRADFLAVVENFRGLGMALHPTFVPFTPWTTSETYADLLRVLAEQELVENVAPIQLGIRLLIPAGSRLLELDDVRRNVGPFDASGLVYPWRHADARLDTLAARVQGLAADKAELTRAEAFSNIWRAASEISELGPPPVLPARPAIPHLSEAWYCCAEPTGEQFVAIGAAAKVAPERAPASAPSADAFV